MINKHTLIIAEAGINHNGDIGLAKEMIDIAKKCGADIVKFQTGKADKLVSRYAEKAEYQKANTGAKESQLDMLKKLILPFEDFVQLEKYCRSVGIPFLSTPFDLDSITFLNTLDMPFWKIPSGEITNLPYLINIGKTGKPVIMSTGMADIQEIRDAIYWLKKTGCHEIKLLHCNTEYPTPYEDVNLKAMQTLRETFGVEVGYSDHTQGIEVPVAAVAMGATMIEKHFTLDRNMEGPDHLASLEPGEFAQMVRAIRNIERSLGDGRKRASPSEQKNKVIARKSVVAQKAIKKGEIFTEENITTKRPGNGISPMRWFEVLGQTANKNFDEDELIEL